MRRNRTLAPLIVIAAALALVGCGGDGGGTGPVADPAVAPFVGTWDAEVFTVTSDADSMIVWDLFLAGGSFFINIQESGYYTATLAFGGNSIPEVGTISVSEGFITLRPNGRDPSTAPYLFVRDDYLAIGPAATDFDFNADGMQEPGQLNFEIQRR